MQQGNSKEIDITFGLKWLTSLVTWARTELDRGASRHYGWQRAVPASRSLQSLWLETENKPWRFLGKYLLLRQSRRQLGIMLCYLSRVAGFCTGTSIYSCIFPSIFQISSSCSIKLSCWNNYYIEIKLGSKQMGEQGLLFWKISNFSDLLTHVCSKPLFSQVALYFFKISAAFCTLQTSHFGSWVLSGLV